MAQYETFAAEYLEHAIDAPYNAHYDRPAVLELLGDVAGKQVLDAGCGPGLYAEELVRRGASVTGIDASPTMVELATDRVPEAEFRVHDLDGPLQDIDDGSFDVVVHALVIHHLQDPPEMAQELFRALRPGGIAVISSHHPIVDWRRLGGSYFDVERITEKWSKGWEVSYLRAPLQYWLDAFTSAGFLIERFVEPRPTDSMREKYPETWDRLTIEPGFFAVRLVKLP